MMLTMLMINLMDSSFRRRHQVKQIPDQNSVENININTVESTISFDSSSSTDTAVAAELSQSGSNTHAPQHVTT